MAKVTFSKRKTSIMVSLLWSLILCQVALGSVQLRVQGASRGPIGVGDRFYITYTVTNSDSEPQSPSTIPGAKVMYFTMTGQSSSFTSVNGRTSQSVSYTYTATCKAEKQGKFSFGPVIVGSEKSNAVYYEIVSAQTAEESRKNPYASTVQRQQQTSRQDPYARSQQQPNEPKFLGKGNDRLFLRASVSKTSAYEQEALVYTVKLYTTYAPIKFIGATSAPKFDGFVVEESSATSSQLKYEEYQGRQYATAVIARYIIFPQTPGKLTIKGNTYTVSTDEQEYYQDPYYSTMTVRRPIQLNVTPNDLTVDVKALPLPKPADFSGGVGKFKIESSMPEKDFKSNQAGSVIYTLTGSGNLKYVRLPDLTNLYPKQIEVYSPTVDTQVQTGTSNVSGKVTFDYSFMPLEPGRYDIPSVTLSYFNPETGIYEKSVARGYTIDVGKGTGSAKSMVKSTRALGLELMQPSELPADNTPYIRTWLYWLCYLLPTVLLGGVVWYYRKLVALKADELGLKSRKAGRIVAKRLRAAAKYLKSGDKSKFYDEMLKAMWGYASDKLKLPTSELNRENAKALMEASGVSEANILTFLNVIDDCEFAKYSSNDSSVTMSQTYADGAKSIERLEEDFKRHKQPQPDLGHP